MSEREALIQVSALDSISNDYEDVATICREVTEWCAEEGLAVEQSEILNALFVLVKRGLAKVYIESPQVGGLVEWENPSIPVDSYLYVTPEGKRLVIARMGGEDN